jgi:DNA-binding response OmpR family regulator
MPLKILLKVMGPSLYQRVTKALASANSPFPRSSAPSKLIHWQLVELQPPFNSSCLDNAEGELSFVLMEIDDLAIIENLRTIEQRESLHVRSVYSLDHELAPLIAILQRDILASDLLDMPDIISDWMIEPVSINDLVRRMFTGMKRRQRLRSELGCGVLTLLPESRTLCYAGNSTQLTASELSVAELFLHHFGTVIPIEDIHLLFKLAGRSTEGSNIRVTMFQLRFKIEAVSRCQFTLTNTYNAGYVLRHTHAQDPEYPDLEARQEVATYGWWN